MSSGTAAAPPAERQGNGDPPGRGPREHRGVQPGERHRERGCRSSLVLTLGYALSVPPLLRLPRLLRERRLVGLGAIEVGLALVAVGWRARGRRLAASVNAAALAAYPILLWSRWARHG
jgi:hypothetical protein